MDLPEQRLSSPKLEILNVLSQLFMSPEQTAKGLSAQCLKLCIDRIDIKPGSLIHRTSSI
jgi:hypothetical protein